MVWTQFATAVHLGVIAGMIYAVFVVPPALHRVVTRRDARLGLAMFAAGIVASLPFVPIVHGYLGFADAWRAERDITEVHNWSAQLRDYLSPTGRLRWYDALAERFPVPTGERRVFPGFMPLLIAAIGAGAGLLGWTDKRRELRTVSTLLVVLAAVAMLFSLGTHWKHDEDGERDRAPLSPAVRSRSGIPGHSGRRAVLAAGARCAGRAGRHRGVRGLAPPVLVDGSPRRWLAC